jgi:hypothetical protein
MTQPRLKAHSRSVSLTAQLLTVFLNLARKELVELVSKYKSRTSEFEDITEVEQHGGRCNCRLQLLNLTFDVRVQVLWASVPSLKWR